MQLKNSQKSQNLFAPLPKHIGQICLEKISVGLFRISKLQLDTHMIPGYSCCLSFPQKQLEEISEGQGKQKSFIRFPHHIQLAEDNSNSPSKNNG
jgi:hypothetical protein